MKKLLVIVSVILVMLIAGTVYAQDAKSYVDLKLGAFYPNDKEDDGMAGFDTGPNLEVDFGYKLNKNFAVELGLGWYQSKSTEFSDEPTVSAIPIILTAKGILPVVDDKIEIFAGAGLGYYMTKAKSEVGLYSVSGNALGWHVVGGADYNISKQFALGLEAKWFTVKPEYDELGFKSDVGGVITNLALKIRF
ncbi:MAG: porin family protein [Nitrospirae bacterium]|nr:porin family protein [Nitrospirota bacterium]